MHMRKSKEATLLKTIINNFTCLEKLLIYYGQKVLKMKVERKKKQTNRRKQCCLYRQIIDLRKLVLWY